MVSVLLVGGMIAFAGCATKTEPVFIQPECSVPPMPADLPEPDVDAVYDAMISFHGPQKGVRITEDLLKRERLIVDSLLEHRAIIEELCRKDNEDK